MNVIVKILKINEDKVSVDKAALRKSFCKTKNNFSETQLDSTGLNFTVEGIIPPLGGISPGENYFIISILISIIFWDLHLHLEINPCTSTEHRP